VTPASVEIVEVGPRDGLQNASVTLAPAVRAELVGLLAGTGLPRIEVASFVHPGRVPRMAGAEEVVAALDAGAGARHCGLVLNERGLDRLLGSGLREARFTFAAADAFNQRNSNASTADGLAAARSVLARARAEGASAGVVLATSFGCPFSGEVDAGLVVELAAELADAGAEEIVFADTIGVAVPRQVRRVLEGAAGLGPRLGVHLHNTRNTGYLCAFVALEAGAQVLDASVGGLGGCPFAPQATGNIATEDLVYMLEREGVATGIDLERLVAVTRWLEERTGLAAPGQLHRVDTFPPRQVASATATG
jgi:hydroxymethylglutaryl-CoA lyase/(R)-citramalyl-CoA lyase